jgi:hypothetical protein
MPTLPKVKRESLAAAAAGSLVSVKNPDGKWTLGLRVLVPLQRGDAQPGFVALLPRTDGGFDARLVPFSSDTQRDFVVSGSTQVANHGDGWSLHVDAQDWNPDFLMNFVMGHSGLLLAEEQAAPNDCGLRLAVEVPYAGACHLLRFEDWRLLPPTPSPQLNYGAARRWNLSLPGTGLDVQWPLGDGAIGNPPPQSTSK